jgi:hypothetical protein
MLKEVHNATGCKLTKCDLENRKFAIARPGIGSMIEVNDGTGLSKRMIVDSYFGNKIICDNDGVEACVALVLNGDVLIWRDITE